MSTFLFSEIVGMTVAGDTDEADVTVVAIEVCGAIEDEGLTAAIVVDALEARNCFWVSNGMFEMDFGGIKVVTLSDVDDDNNGAEEDAAKDDVDDDNILLLLLPWLDVCG